jgi:hypothetical protein
MGTKKLRKPTSNGNEEQRPAVGMNDREWNQLMETVEEIKKEADKKLEELSSICLNRECNGERSK